MKWFLIFVTALSFQIQAQEKLPALIKVSSFAERTLEPNVIIIDVQAWARAQTSQQAQEQAAKEVKKLRELFEKHKIKKEDIQTTSFNTSPEYRYNPKTGAQRIESYRTQHSIVLTIKNIEIAGGFVDQISQASQGDARGISVNSINWDSDQKSKAEAEAMSEAIKISRERADIMAKAAGVKVNGVFQISNQQAYSYGEHPVAELAQARFSKAADAAAVPTQLSPGKIKIRADVNVEYYIKN